MGRGALRRGKRSGEGVRADGWKARGVVDGDDEPVAADGLGFSGLDYPKKRASLVASPQPFSAANHRAHMPFLFDPFPFDAAADGPGSPLLAAAGEPGEAGCRYFLQWFRTCARCLRKCINLAFSCLSLFNLL
ncbi:hypothetical protein EJB05_01585, partial [Eragrostis curvula]